MILEPHGGAFQRPLFTTDGRLMAVGIARDQVLLADAATGREIVRLTTLQPVGAKPLAFSPDGTKLAAGTEKKTVLLWDLRRIRGQLIPPGLDWDARGYLSPTSTASRAAVRRIPPPRTVRAVGEVLEPQARRKAERALMNRRLTANPKDAEALIHRGWLSLIERKLPESIADFDHARGLQHDDSDVDWMLVQAHQEMDDLAGALPVLSRMLARAPQDRDARFERGLVALALGLPQQAADDFDRILATDSTDGTARYHRARALNRSGRYLEALPDFDVLIANVPDDFGAYELRATAHDALGSVKLARLDREKSRSLLTNDAEVLNRWAWELVTGPRARRDPERALVPARQAVALKPNDSSHVNTLGLVLYRAGRYAEAVNVLERNLKTGQGKLDGFDLIFLAMVHHDLGQSEEARACLDRARYWRDRQTSLSPHLVWQLTVFSGEAEALLAAPGADLPADLFAPP
jgi:tetratricopeptide (TPR) repeat protein